MRRRVHVPTVASGRLTLGAAESHHLRDVLRVQLSTAIEVFDSSGRSAVATLVRIDVDHIEVEVGSVEMSPGLLQLTIAAAVPKGDRADWMVEKLSELGVAAFIPLASARSIVLPTGRGKAERWQRIAIEAAKQSRRGGVMTIAPLTKVADALHAAGSEACVASTRPGARPLLDLGPPRPLTVFIGPEGGWTDTELGLFAQANAVELTLSRTILRVETAAMAAAAILLCR